jgi:hypothetical protein
VVLISSISPCHERRSLHGDRFSIAEYGNFTCTQSIHVLLLLDVDRITNPILNYAERRLVPQYLSAAIPRHHAGGLRYGSEWTYANLLYLDIENMHMPGEFGGYPPDFAAVAEKRMSRDSVRASLEMGEKNFDGRDLRDLDLAELELAGALFRGADVRGLQLCRDNREQTDISDTDWTDAVFADLGPNAVFQYVRAERAVFGFSETLADRKKRLDTFVPNPTAKDVGAYNNFDGRGANFKSSRWSNIHFGGEVDADGQPREGWESLFQMTDFSEAKFIGVDLTGIDWSREVIIENITMQDPVSLRGLLIAATQLEWLAKGIRFSSEENTDKWNKARKEKGDAIALQEFFGVIVVADERAD